MSWTASWTVWTGYLDLASQGERDIVARSEFTILCQNYQL